MKHSYPLHENDFLNKLEAGDQEGLHEALENIVKIFVEFTLDQTLDMSTRQTGLLVLDSKLLRHEIFHRGNEFFLSAIDHIRGIVKELKAILKSELKHIFKAKSQQKQQLDELYTDTPPPSECVRMTLNLKPVALVETIYFEWRTAKYTVNGQPATISDILGMYRENHGVELDLDTVYELFRGIRNRKGKSRIPMHNEKENIPNRAYYIHSIMNAFNEYIRCSEGQDARTTEKPDFDDCIEADCV